ncbi:myosin heavy subunit [Staphylococcus cohnii]
MKGLISMLTKEFAQRVELSEKQVRKIVQHLEERGYQLSKTEYRGREATDFQEEDIELFQDIADKVKQTNSYDLAFEELEKEKDFLQVLVKEDDNNLPSDQNVSLLVEDLRTEIQNMRDERQMLGQMINQVHQQQQELHKMQNQITSKLEENTESLKAIQSSTDEIKSTQSVIQDSQKEQTELVKSNVESESVHTNQSSINNEANAFTENITEQANTKVTPDKMADTTDPHTNEVSENVSAETVDEEITQISEQPTAQSVQSPNSEDEKQTSKVNSADKADDSIKPDTHKEASEVEQKTDHNKAVASASSTANESDSQQSNASKEATSTTSYGSPLAKEERKEERKGFFARLFNL